MKTITRVDVENYTYDQYTDGTVLVLNKYTGTDTDVVVPVIETIEIESVRLTIDAIPLDATIEFYDKDGIALEKVLDNAVDVDKNSTVQYIVSAEGYNTKSDTLVVTEDTTLSVELEQIKYTLTIIPTPSEAIVTLTAEGYIQEDNSITVLPGTTVTYVVECKGYETFTDSVVVSENTNLDIILEEKKGIVFIYNYGSCVIGFVDR